MHQTGMHEHIGEQRPRLQDEAGERGRQRQQLEYPGCTPVEQLQQDVYQSRRYKNAYIDVYKLYKDISPAKGFFKISYNMSHDCCFFSSNT